MRLASIDVEFSCKVERFFLIASVVDEIKFTREFRIYLEENKNVVLATFVFLEYETSDSNKNYTCRKFVK
jgi:hypothetical protein